MVELNYEVHGQGEPLICLHGFGANLGSWKLMVPYLEKKYRLFLLDLKGFGQSPQPRDDKYSVFDQADLVLNFIAQKNLKNVTLVGNSFGGGVALVSAWQLQLIGEKLRALVLVDSAAYKQTPPLYMILLRVPVLSNLLLKVPTKLAVRTIMKGIYYDHSKISQERILNYSIASKREGYAYVLKQTVKQLIPANIGDLEKEFSKIEAPTLIIHGDHDKVIPLSISERLHREIKNSELVVLPRCGHVPQEEYPELTAEKVNLFLSRISCE